ncbi:MAG: helix-turn-helix transcriptional regulator [Blastocatellia bacterium]|nr:helix-turn-helix transcriptional regulator [Blastocatellia bacterium]MBK6428148.1 helix-turn-helix transcriptional regulator [Blastocatellia bacterium]
MRKKSMTYTIGVVAETYGLHQQTLRLYEREGLLKPSRSKGNTRLYTDEDLVRLETILSLTRDLGVNLAGVGIILDMLERMDQMQRDFEQILAALREHMAAEPVLGHERASLALVPRRVAPIIAVRRPADE